MANHNTVNNPQLLPALQLIDYAQRNNTVGSLTAEDVSRSMGVGGNTTVVSAPQVNVTTDNSELHGTLQQARETIEKLGALLQEGIHSDVSIEEIERKRQTWEFMQRNK